MSLLTGKENESDPRVLYERAQDKQKYDTVARRSWSLLLTDVYHGTGLHLVAEQPPDHGGRRVDLIAHRIERRAVASKLYIEFKKARTTYNPDARYAKKRPGSSNRLLPEYVGRKPWSEGNTRHALLRDKGNHITWIVRRDGTWVRPPRTIRWIDAKRDINGGLAGFLSEVLRR